MSRSSKLFIILFCSISFTVFGQSKKLYTPLEVENALSKGTRSLEGRPGPNYWQNSADYKIRAELNPDSSTLKGHVDITYYNNSPDTLKSIFIRLYQDILKKGSARDWYVGNVELHDGVKITNLKVNGIDVNMDPSHRELFYTSTNMMIKLSENFAPNTSLKIEMNFSFKIPQIIRLRMGNYGDGDYFVAYWYPQIAVYDDIDGWDKQEYTGSVEFYNDFNNYEFEISLPDSFVVWATGELQNEKEVFKENIIKKLDKAKESDKIVQIISPADFAADRVTIKNGTNTWKFIASNVPDISFCLSNNFNWDAASIEVEPGRRVLTSAVYENGTINFDKATEYSRATIEYLSEQLPGYPYPYPQVTTFCNKGRGGGMETPMMANDGAPESLGRYVGLVFHEIAHNYFPFMMGTNERKYAWMDEGWASFFPIELVDKLLDNDESYAGRVKSFENNSGKEAELPPMIVSYSNRGEARTAAYDRPAVAYKELYELLGRDLFKKSLLEYINRWIGKHPIPSDFFYTFDQVTNEDLSWFWKPWFFEFGYPDLAIDSVIKETDGITVNINKIGNMPVRVLLQIEFEDGRIENLQKSARVWKDKDEFIIEYKSSEKIKNVKLGDPTIPDINQNNNFYSLK